jgi:hypothetical protein
MAKDAKTYFMVISCSALANGVLPFDDLNDLFLPPYLGNAGGAARISSNSWGSAVAGAYDLNAMQVDQFMWNHPDFYIAFSNGNSGPTIATVGSPATAKNLASMGGSQNGTTTVSNRVYNATSRGPTADGRRKPTYCAPGQSVNSAQSGPANYGVLSGTSMASPSGTGNVVLMRQYLTDGWYPTGAPTAGNGFNPSAALLKAMAVNSADFGMRNSTGATLFNTPDNNVGYGRIQVDNVLYFPGDQRKLLLVDNTDGLGQGQYIEYQVNVTDTTLPLEVALCWTDYPGSPAASVQLVNNLDLTVTNGASTYKGNVFSAGSSVTGGATDVLNTEEDVTVAVPTAGLWTIRVAAPTVPVGPQPFGMCVTGGVGQDAGALALDRAQYGATSTMDLRVTDTNAGGSVNVLVTSNTEPAGENVVLTGSGGVLTGTLQLGNEASTPSNGALGVARRRAHGDVQRRLARRRAGGERDRQLRHARDHQRQGDEPGLGGHAGQLEHEHQRVRQGLLRPDPRARTRQRARKRRAPRALGPAFGAHAGRDLLLRRRGDRAERQPRARQPRRQPLQVHREGLGRCPAGRRRGAVPAARGQNGSRPATTTTTCGSGRAPTIPCSAT